MRPKLKAIAKAVQYALAEIRGDKVWRLRKAYWHDQHGLLLL